MSALFITSTGTGIGKTLVTAALTYQLRIQHKSVMAIKPVISGLDGGIENSDTAVLCEALGRKLSNATIDTISPFRFQAPLAPSQAAMKEGKSLDYLALIKFCNEVINAFDHTIIEGVGGSFVPLDGNKLVADWISDLKLDSLLVTGNYLGTLSHTIATLEAMDSRGLNVRSVIVSDRGDQDIALDDTVDELKYLTGLDVRGLEFVASPTPWKFLPDLTKFA